MKLYIVLPISQLKRLNKILICIILLIPFRFYGQEADSIKINYNFIDSNPQNVSVFVNEKYIGNTPLFFEWKDSTLPKTIKIELKGYSGQSENISSYQLINKKYILVSRGNLSIVNIINEDKQTYFNSPRKIVPIVISSIITAGGGIAAYYFKSLASDNQKLFDDFGDAGALDKKKKYDVLGGVSLVVFQAGLGVLLYYLLID